MKMDPLFARYRVEPVRRYVASPLRRGLVWALRFSRLVRFAWKARARLTWRQRLRAWRHGFAGNSYATFDFDRNDPDLYHTDYSSFVRDEDINGDFGSMVNTKHLFACMLDALGAPQPRLHGLVRRGRWHPWPDGLPVLDAETAVRGLLRERGRLVLKPSRGGSGEGLIFLRERGGRVDINGVEEQDGDLGRLLARLCEYMATDYARQAEYAARIYPETANTVRILTLWDYDKGEPFIAAAAQRIGTSRSYPVDNWHGGNGGLSCAIDLDTGALGPGASLSADGRLVFCDRHPETGAQIQGVTVPFWAETKALLLRLAARLPSTPDVGWDLVITDDGPSLIEGNAPPGTFVWQVHAPLYRDARVRTFFAAHDAL